MGGGGYLEVGADFVAVACRCAGEEGDDKGVVVNDSQGGAVIEDGGGDGASDGRDVGFDLSRHEGVITSVFNVVVKVVNVRNISAVKLNPAFRGKLADDP